jgi:hypothetical protein
MNTVIFASDSKGVASVINVVRELERRNSNYFFLYSEETQLQYPSLSLDNFSYDSNVSLENWKNIWSDTLQVSLPFVPEVLLLQRDCWQPEQSIIHEFKTKWNCKIAMVETNTHLTNNPETILEMHSRTRYPQNQIDLYFEQSQFTKTERSKSGFDTSKSVVVGNPKYDHLLSVDVSPMYSKYELNKTKTQILFYSVINLSRNEMFQCLKMLLDKVDHSKYEILFKPYPFEPIHEKFSSQISPFIFDNVKVIYDDKDIYPLAKICDIHIGVISSITHFPLLLKKKIININNFCTYLNGSHTIERYLKEANVGVEDSAKFWMRVHSLATLDDFIKLVNPDRLLTYKTDIDKFISIIQECTIDFDANLQCLTKEMPNTNKLLALFDDYNDYNASPRIVEELNKLYVQ